MSYGYYHASLSLQNGHALLRSNNERAFVIAVLQDALSPRLLIGTVPAYRQLASCIDLLAFSIRSDAIRLVFFTIDPSIAQTFITLVKERLAAYQSELHVYPFPGSYEYTTSLKKLRGAHHALEYTIQLHLLHEDWEYDRYSSISFYLHDRRGDWMRIWRVAQLYDSLSANYRNLIYATISTPKGLELPTPQLLAS